MSCCANHDRMDRLLAIDDYNDFPCGTPTNPRGEQRYCCRQCPAHGQPLAVKAVWAGNPTLLGYLSDDERAQVIALAVAAGPDRVDIVTVTPTAAPSGTQS